MTGEITYLKLSFSIGKFINRRFVLNKIEEHTFLEKATCIVYKNKSRRTEESEPARSKDGDQYADKQMNLNQKVGLQFCKLELYGVEELKYVLDKLSCFVPIRLYYLFGLRSFGYL